MKKLTNKQREYYEFLKEYLSDNGFPPTVREIAEKFDVFLKAAHDHLVAIEKKGYIKRNGNARSITLILEQNKTCQTCFYHQEDRECINEFVLENVKTKVGGKKKNLETMYSENKFGCPWWVYRGNDEKSS